MSGYKPKPRQSYGSFGNYHKKRASTCHYNRGLYWMDPAGGAHPQKGILEFQKAICADPYNEDAKYQLQILESYHGVTADEVAKACIALDCSGCRYINAQKS